MFAVGGCDGCGDPPCGINSGVVAAVIDGDTIDLESGERVRYLMIDTPETTGGKDECFGTEATQFNTDLVLGKEVDLVFDEECEDRFGRLLAYVSVDGREVNSLIIERGYGCVLFIPPSGADREDEFLALEAAARAGARGVWGACEDVPCEN
jgi:micrococcal nuclease